VGPGGGWRRPGSDPTGCGPRNPSRGWRTRDCGGHRWEERNPLSGRELRRQGGSPAADDPRESVPVSPGGRRAETAPGWAKRVLRQSAAETSPRRRSLAGLSVDRLRPLLRRAEAAVEKRSNQRGWLTWSLFSACGRWVGRRRRRRLAWRRPGPPEFGPPGLHPGG